VSSGREAPAQIGYPDEVARAFDQLPAMVAAYHGPEHRVVATSRAARDYLRVHDRTDLLGRPLRDIVPEAAGQEWVEQLDEVYRTGRPSDVRDGRLVMPMPDGSVSERFIRVLASPLRDPEGDVVGVVELVEDVTDDVHTRFASEARATGAPSPTEGARDVVMTLQRNLLSEHLPVLPGVRIAAHYLVAGRELSAGGDWFDAVTLDGGRLALVIGDVVGHGASASGIMGQLRAVLRERLAATGDLATAVHDLDRFAAVTPGARSATMCVGLLTPSTGALAYLCCGHPPPIVTGPNGTRSLPPPSGSPLGVGEPEPEISEVTLAPNEAVLLYSDGLVERRDRTLDDGREALEAVVDAAWRTPAVPGGTLPVDRAQRVSALTVERMTRAGHEDDVTVLIAEQLARPTPPLCVDLDVREVDLADVRSRVTRWLAVHGTSEEDVCALELAVSEAVANVVDHAYRDGAGGRLQVRGELDVTGAVALEVEDGGTWRPPEGHDDERGRGLVLMRAFVDDLGLEHDDRGTRVRMRRRVHTTGILGTRPAAAATGSTVRASFTVERPVGGTGRVRVRGPLDTAAATRLRRAARDALRGERDQLELDITEVDLLGSAAVRELYRLAAELDGGLHVAASAGSVPYQVLQLVGLARVLRSDSPGGDGRTAGTPDYDA
jgi:anti-sigma regulatory factor (Ser/Thr protein kinase)/anti-anti-sigma regulatory factor